MSISPIQARDSEVVISRSIPKILHQLWIGPHPAPHSMMATWKAKHPHFEYIIWTEAEIQRRGLVFVSQPVIDFMDELNGKADIMRWEILYKFGGYFVDADSICIHPFESEPVPESDAPIPCGLTQNESKEIQRNPNTINGNRKTSYFANKTAFATFENESIRRGLVATGTMGFVPGHPLCRDIIAWINSPESLPIISTVKAWGAVGPGLLTRFLDTGNYPNFSVYPSHCFLPIHFTGNTYLGHKKVYAYQAWGATNDSYSTMNDMELPAILREPALWVSVLICSYNTERLFIRECLDSIRSQNGVFGIEVVWVNDGSTDERTEELEEELAAFMESSRFCKVVYERLAVNSGVAAALNRGIDLCSCDLIFRMDSDDIMVPNRLKTQMEFMRNTKDCVCCGANMSVFVSGNGSVNESVNGSYNEGLGKGRGNEGPSKQILTTTEHPQCIQWSRLCEVYREHGGIPSWIMNHPTLCYYKDAVVSVGKYDVGVGSLEDYDLELRLIKKHGVLYNIQENLLLYRSHDGQVTRNVDEGVVDGMRSGVLRGVFDGV